MGDYPDYESLKLDWPAPYVLRVTISRGKVNSMDHQLHHDIAEIWPIINRDDDVGAVVVTGEGKYFSAGGDFQMEEDQSKNWNQMVATTKDSRALMENMINCSKPIISAINGPAAGGGLCVALMADVSFMARSAKLVDAHTRLGIAAGDHASLIWPLLCGMAKAKYYIYSCDPISAEEAERIGLVSVLCDDDKLMDQAVEFARRLANDLAPTAMRWTKQTMNGWLRMAWPIIEGALGYSALGFFGPDLAEGLASHVEKRKPNFNPRSPA